MAKKISELDSDTNLDGTEQLIVAQNGETRKTSLQAIKAYSIADITQDIVASTSPVVNFKDYPVSGSISKGQPVTLVREDNMIKMKRVTETSTTISVGASGFQDKVTLSNQILQDDSNNNISVFPFDNLAFSNILKESDTRYYLIGNVSSRVYDTYDVETATNKPKSPTRMFSESLTGSSVFSVVIIPMNVAADGAVTYEDYYFYRPEIYKKIKTGTESFVDRTQYDTRFLQATLMENNKIMLAFSIAGANPRYANNTNLWNGTLPAGKTNIRTYLDQGDTMFAIIDPINKKQWFAEYDNYHSNFFESSGAIGFKLNRAGQGMSISKVNSSRIVCHIRGYNSSGSPISDDDGFAISTSDRGDSGIFGIFNITEGQDTVDGETLDTFTIGKQKVVSMLRRNERWSYIPVADVVGNVWFNGQYAYLFNSTFDDFVRTYNSVTQNYTNSSSNPPLFQNAMSNSGNAIETAVNGATYNSAFLDGEDYWSAYQTLFATFRFVTRASDVALQAHLYGGYGFVTNRVTADYVDVLTSDDTDDVIKTNFFWRGERDHRILATGFTNAGSYGFFIKDLGGIAVDIEDTRITSTFGLAADNYSDADTGRLIFLKGSTTIDLYSNLIIGQTYYLDKDGNLTTNSGGAGATTIKLGRAISTTEIALEIT